MSKALKVRTSVKAGSRADGVSGGVNHSQSQALRVRTMFRKTLAAATLAFALAVAALAGAQPASALVQCGVTITANTTLTGDLMNCPKDGIRVTAPNVVLDLGGHVIDGSDPGSPGIGIAVYASNVTVRNGTIRDFEYGVYFSSVSTGTVSGAKMTDNKYGVHSHVFAQGVTVKGNDIGYNQVHGVFMRGNSHRVEGNALHDNGADGLWLDGFAQPGAGNVITANQAYRNKINGMRIWNARDADI
jgi:hypothetical protein